MRKYQKMKTNDDESHPSSLKERLSSPDSYDNAVEALEELIILIDPPGVYGDKLSTATDAIAEIVDEALDKAESMADKKEWKQELMKSIQKKVK